MDGLSNRDINVSIVFHMMSYMLYPLYGIIVYDVDPMIPPMNIYIYIYIPYSNDIPHCSYIIHPYLFHPVISVIIVYSIYSQHPEVTTTNFVDRSVNAKSCDGGSDGFVHRALANGM